MSVPRTSRIWIPVTAVREVQLKLQAGWNGSAAIDGLLDDLRDRGEGNRRYIARSFPEPLAGKARDDTKWPLLRVA